MCGSSGVRVCDCVGVWVCGCVGVWVCGCVGVGKQNKVKKSMKLFKRKLVFKKDKFFVKQAS